MVCAAPPGSPAAVARATSRYRPSASLRPPTTPENCQALAPARDGREIAPMALQPFFFRCWTTNRVVPFRSSRQVTSDPSGRRSRPASTWRTPKRVGSIRSFVSRSCDRDAAPATAPPLPGCAALPPAGPLPDAWAFGIASTRPGPPAPPGACWPGGGVAPGGVEPGGSGGPGTTAVSDDAAWLTEDTGLPASSTTRSRKPRSAAPTVYVAPLRSPFGSWTTAQLVPSAEHRCQRSTTSIGAVPVQAPGVAVSVPPFTAWPLRDGDDVLVGSAGENVALPFTVVQPECRPA